MKNLTLTRKQYDALQKLLYDLDQIEDVQAYSDGDKAEVFWLAGNIFVEPMNILREFMGLEKV